MKNLLAFVSKKLFLNWKKPWYSKSLFRFCCLYVDFCYGDNNFDRNTNGEYRIIKILASQIHTMFDIGANIGDYSSEIKKNNPATVIHCFEPDARAFSLIEKKEGLIARNIALGDKPGTLALHLHLKSEHNSFLNTGDSSSKTQNVTVSTLDDYCQKNSITHIDFMKIDVEGWEYLVLQGGRKMFEKGAVDYVQFEFSGASRQARTFLKDFIDFFDTYHYDVYRIKPSSIEKVIYNPAKERFTLTNYLAIKSGIIISKELHAKNTDF